MLKQLHKLFLIAIIGCFLYTPQVVFAESGVPSEVQGVSQNNGSLAIQHDILTEDAHTGPLDTGTIKESVVPDPSKEGKKVVGLFLKTMIAVIFCSAILFVVLFFLKKNYAELFIKPKEESEELDNLDLSTPNSRNDALKSFLNRTK